MGIDIPITTHVIDTRKIDRLAAAIKPALDAAAEAEGGILAVEAEHALLLVYLNITGGVAQFPPATLQRRARILLSQAQNAVVRAIVEVGSWSELQLEAAEAEKLRARRQ